MAKQSSKTEQMGSTENDSKPGARFVVIDYDDKIIKFNIFTVRSDNTKRRAFGSGRFEEQDLERIVAELGQLARDLGDCDAKAKAAVQARGGRGEGGGA
jgi:hypothetical protein